MHWSEVFVAIYLGPSRIFPLVGSWQLKKQQGFPDKIFVELVLGDWRVVDLGKIIFQAPKELGAALGKPLAIFDNIKSDPSQMESQNWKRKNQTVPCNNFLFRLSDARGTSEAVSVLMDNTG